MPHSVLAKKKVNNPDKHQLSRVIKANINSGGKSYWQCVPLTQWHFISVVKLLKTPNPSLIAKKSIRGILNPSWGIKCVWSDMIVGHVAGKVGWMWNAMSSHLLLDSRVGPSTVKNWTVNTLQRMESPQMRTHCVSKCNSILEACSSDLVNKPRFS